jgi:thiol-disulfide isomerase/thioredoxin
MSMKAWSNLVPRRAITLGLVSLASSALVGCGGGAAGTNGGADTPESSGGGAVEVGKEAPEVKGEHVAGDGPTSLAEGKGQVVIVDFWATFCDPCRKSFPAYQELVDKYAGDLAVIAVSVDDPEDVTAEEVKQFGEELGVSFPLVWDKGQETAGVYNPPKMPTSYIIDTDGVLRHIHAGYESGEQAKIDEEVGALLE